MESGAGVLGRQAEKISLEEDDEIAESSLSQVSLLSLQLQSLNYSTPPRSKQDLLPLPIPLRVRTSRRCRAELAEGRPGILLKPKLNPLEGDTSLVRARTVVEKGTLCYFYAVACDCIVAYVRC
jgi:hypothetical protein